MISVRAVVALLVVAAVSAGGWWLGEQRRGAQPEVRVLDVIDGDTIVVALPDGTTDTVRVLGIDTPETKHPSLPVQCFGREASEFTAELLPTGTEVRLVYDVERLDRYNRTLAYVYRVADRLFVNAELLRQGYAQVATFPRNVTHVDEFLELQAEARAKGRGLWRACDGNSRRAADVRQPLRSRVEGKVRRASRHS